MITRGTLYLKIMDIITNEIEKAGETPAPFKYCDYNDVLSYGAPYNIINMVRETGKSLAGKKRAYFRHIRKGTSTIWVRRTEGATIKTRATFLNKKFFKFTNADPERVRIKGNYADVNMSKNKNSGAWEHFVEFVTLSKKDDERSADEGTADLFLIDEGLPTREKMRQYRGDEVNDALDLYESKRRDDRMQFLVLGNRESVANPYLNYFGCETPPFDFNGIKAFKQNTIIYQQSTIAPPEKSEFDNKIKIALEGTKYGAFKYKGVAQGFDLVHIKNKPKNAEIYGTFDFGFPVTMWTAQNAVYFTSGVDLSRPAIVLKETDKYKNAYVVKSTDRQFFAFLRNARRLNAIYYDNPATAEIAQTIIEILA